MLVVAVVSVAEAREYQTLGGEVSLALPEEWVLATDSIEFPFQVFRVDPVAELLIFRSVIPEDVAIRNTEDLKLSVEKVIDDVIMDINGAKLLTSTGYDQDYRTGFLLEFLSTDTINQTQVRNRFKGIVYRHPDGYQILYTLWGKVAAADYTATSDEIQFMENNFRYIGSYEREVFASANNRYYYLLGVFGLLGVLLWIYRKRLDAAGRVSETFGRESANTARTELDQGVYRSKQHQQE
jgi:hypothetical protein